MPFRILSLDGGGIRGVISARILAAIEKQINQPLNE
jgi:patatin-like phospholipase/acyl hydrolase